MVGYVFTIQSAERYLLDIDPDHEYHGSEACRMYHGKNRDLRELHPQTKN